MFIQSHFEKKYRKYQGDDPIEIFLEYVKQCELYIHKSNDENDRQMFVEAYVNLVKRCMRYDKYKDDKRFIKFFLNYVLIF